MNRLLVVFSIFAFTLAGLSQLWFWYVILFVPPPSPPLLYVFGSFVTIVYVWAIVYSWMLWRRQR